MSGTARTHKQKAEQQELIAAGLVASQTAEYPNGVMTTAAEFAGVPRTTALRWVTANDEEFKSLRREYKRGFVGRGTAILDELIKALYKKATDPEQMAKLPIDKAVWSIGTLYDKIALASGEQEASAVNALLAGVALGRAVERGRRAPGDTDRSERREERGEVIDVVGSSID